MSAKREVAIKISKLKKKYTIRHEKPTFVGQMISRSRSNDFEALKGIDLTIFKGEKVGLVGTNGSGKTTLLKMICGISSPTTGTIKTFGKVVSLIELTAGFHPDLTGEENIFLNGLVIGMSNQEITEKYSEIIEFADIGQFIDSPLYTYSDGMKLRLGFSIAIHADPDVLIVDEGIMAGDEQFQLKSGNKIEEMFKANKTIVVATHFAKYLETHCDRIIWINKGEVHQDGGLEVINNYLSYFWGNHAKKMAAQKNT